MHIKLIYYPFIIYSQSQLGAMISSEPSVLEACGGFIPEPGDLKTLLLHQQSKGILSVKGML